jgi:hypothetical protein
VLDAYALNAPDHHGVNLYTMSCFNCFSVLQASIGECLLDDANYSLTLRDIMDSQDYLRTVRDIMNSQDYLRTLRDITNSQDEISQNLESKKQSIEKLLKAYTAGSPNHPEDPAPQDCNGKSINQLVGGTEDELRKVRAHVHVFCQKKKSKQSWKELWKLLVVYMQFGH